jgi:hypothetical protein
LINEVNKCKKVFVEASEIFTHVDAEFFFAPRNILRVVKSCTFKTTSSMKKTKPLMMRCNGLLTLFSHYTSQLTKFFGA